ncbi:hypothetical protein ACQKKX_08840 [Neorhizobium sp. NPDC001467]|uniref:hypothetical protein n=1 Tax=Neorhizobium sp. NPDC001467 TaxID=3390595 RepID=UPI003D07DFC6
MSRQKRDWSKVAAEIVSYRQMYNFAREIADSVPAETGARHAANLLAESLEEIIDKPIAAAKQLARARRRFERLKAVLAA